MQQAATSNHEGNTVTDKTDTDEMLGIPNPRGYLSYTSQSTLQITDRDCVPFAAFSRMGCADDDVGPLLVDE